MTTESYVDEAKKALYGTFGNSTTVARMPATFVDNSIGSGDTRNDLGYYVEQFRKRSGELASYLGLKEYYDGSVPVGLEDLDMYGAAGVTRFELCGNKVRARDVKLHTKLAEAAKRKGSAAAYMQRVADHELMHVLSADLLQYADVDQKTATAIIESLPEWGMYAFHLEKGETTKAEMIRRTTPYKGAFQLGAMADRFYESRSGRGYRAFIEDIQKHESMGAAMGQLNRCMIKAGCRVSAPRCAYGKAA
ncbi:MAG: hypothetical protein ABIG30_02665 [Candidatus Aenigmatarchaeota archaeon]